MVSELQGLIFLFLTVCANSVMTYLKIAGLNTSKNYILRSVNGRDILFFGNNSRDTSQSLYSLQVHRLKLICFRDN